MHPPPPLPAPAARPPVPWPVRSVVFDLDGLLVDTEPIFTEVARQVLGCRGHTLMPDVVQGMLGSPARQALQLFREYYDLHETVEELTIECSTRFYDVLGTRPAPLLPGALDLLERLERKGVPRAIATSSGAAYVNRVLAPHGILDRFAFVLTCEDVTLGKPFPEVYEKAAARFGHDPAEMLVLEDSPNGVRAAKAAGARCILVPQDPVEPALLDMADAVLGSLTDPRLHEWLGV
jgi:HAD superfamily hydrolase (TIGR01509 family)